MKIKYLTSLFFCVCFLNNINKHLNAQAKVDSTNLYYNAIYFPHKNDISIYHATAFFEKEALKLIDKKDTLKAIRTYQYLISGYLKTEKVFESEVAAVNAFMLLDNMSLDSIVRVKKTRISNQLGRIYRRIKDYDSSIDYYNISLELAEGILDSISALNNLSTIYIDLKNYNKAASTAESCYNKILKLNNHDKKNTVLDNLGYAQSKLKTPGALEKMQLALSSRLKVNDLNGIFTSYEHITNYYIDTKNREMALHYMNKALAISDSMNSPDSRYKALQLFGTLYDNNHVNELIHLGDSLHADRYSNQSKYAAKKYSLEKSEKEAVQNKLLAEERQNEKVLAIIGIGVMLFASIILFFYYKQRNKIAKTKERHKTEQKLSKKVHDEVGNDVFYLMTQIQSSPQKFLDKNGLKILDGLNDIYSKARDISKDYTSVNTGSVFNEELLTLLNSYGTTQTKIITSKIEPDFWQSVSKDKKEQLYRVLQELLTNMKKHSDATLVAITFLKQNRNIIVKYADNGKGALKSELKTNSGLYNVENRIESINGTITFDTSPNNGFKAELTFMA